MNDKSFTAVGILAHVDAGKTSLSEQLLFKTGVTRKAGRVDNGDTAFDFYEQERERGITIFSKQSSFTLGDRNFTLIDTPGHIDFIAETERALSVLDCAIVVVDGVEGVQTQTSVIWNMLKEKEIPAFIFVSKSDRDTFCREKIISDIKSKLDPMCLDFTDEADDEKNIEETVSICEAWIDKYFAGEDCGGCINEAVKCRQIFPVVCGSSVTGCGTDRLLELLRIYAPAFEAHNRFGARVYKITRDSKGDRITFVKITGGQLIVKDYIGEEKVNQIRIYNAGRFALTETALPGMCVGLTGLSETYPGQWLGNTLNKSIKFDISPAVAASVTSDNTDTHSLIKHLRFVAEEIPEMKVITGKINGTEQVRVGVMGRIQLEVIGDMLAKRGCSCSFGQCGVLYKETVAAPVMGYGHYEPLRHYAEAHIRIEPMPRNSGISVENECSLEVLDANYQNLVLTHIAEKEHIGILTGSPLTDVKYVLTAGRSHLKHTEGGDFREATYRAIRQGLEKAENILLEPYFDFSVSVPSDCTGRVLNDLQKMSCTFGFPGQNGEFTVINGSGPVSELMNYSEDIASFSKGKGSAVFKNAGYRECHNTENVIADIGYEKERDLENPSSSVFCSHGAGFEVKWFEVEGMKHI